MAFNANLLKALQIFGDGVKSAGTTSAISSANERIKAVRESQLEDEERRFEMRKVAQEAAVQILAITQDPKLAESAKENLLPSSGGKGGSKTFQAGIIGGDPDEVGRIQAFKERELSRKKSLSAFNQGLKGGDIESKKQEVFLKQADKFGQRPDVREAIKQLNASDTAQNLVNDGGKSNLALANTLIIKMTGDSRISDLDYERARSASNLPLNSRIANSLSEFTSGKGSDLNQAEMRNMLNIVQAAIKNKITRTAEGFSARRFSGSGLTKSAFVQALLIETGQSFKKKQPKRRSSGRKRKLVIE